jgi:hypothetical protein
MGIQYLVYTQTRSAGRQINKVDTIGKQYLDSYEDLSGDSIFFKESGMIHLNWRQYKALKYGIYTDDNGINRELEG